MKIHPTAIIGDGAQLADDVEIGPGSIVSAASVIGPRCVLGAHVILENRVVLGAGNRIGHGSILGANPQDLGFDTTRTDTGVRLGDNNTIREYVTIHRATKENGDTMIGDGNFLMTGCHLGHDVQLGGGVVMANNALVAGHARVHDRAFLGGGSVFHQFISIGTLVIVRGGCRFSKNIPPFTAATGENHVAGLNTIGLRRAGFTPEVRAEIKRAFRLLYTSGLNISQALEAAAGTSWGPEAAGFFEFVRESKARGVCDYAGEHEAGDE